MQEAETSIEIKEEQIGYRDITDSLCDESSLELPAAKEEIVPEVPTIFNVNISEIAIKVNEWEQQPLDEDSKCPVCAEEIKCTYELMTHYQKKLECLPSFCKCPVCDDGFYPRTKEKLERHLLFHTGNNGYKCPECKIAHPTIKSLRQHIQKLHEGIKPFNCDICKKGKYTEYVLNTNKFLKNLLRHVILS